MNWNEKRAWLKTLTETHGVPGQEGAIKKLLLERLDGVATIRYDKLGSVIFEARNSSHGPRIMLAAHMDEIGFFVKHITKEGFIKFAQLGGWPDQVVLGQRVEIITKHNKYLGIIGSKPPHVMDVEERAKLVKKEDMFIDIGAASDSEVASFGICPGDAIAPLSEFTTLNNDKLLLAKAWDDRVGCALIADVIEALSERNHPNSVFGVGTVQEEVGLRGARTAVNAVRPDIAIAIDVGINGDMPGVAPEKSTVKLGAGPAITVFDASMIPNRALVDFVVSTCAKHAIPYQYSVIEGGGTDAGAIHISDCGVPSIVLTVPCRYIHSYNSLIHCDDYDNTLKLILALIDALDNDCYNDILIN